MVVCKKINSKLSANQRGGYPSASPTNSVNAQKQKQKKKTEETQRTGRVYKETRKERKRERAQYNPPCLSIDSYPFVDHVFISSEKNKRRRQKMKKKEL